jgi:hypothetical protein
MRQRRGVAQRACRRRVTAGEITAVVLGFLLWPSTMARWEVIIVPLFIAAAVVAWPLYKDYGATPPDSVTEWSKWRNGRRDMEAVLHEGLNSQ